MSDADGSWPADPLDPRCPACDGPVSATTTYCMHCGVDLPTTDDSGIGAGDPRAADGTPDPTASTDAAGRDWLHPEGFLDDSLTVTVGVVAGAVGGALVATALAWALPGGWPFLAGAAAWVLTTVSVARSRTVFGAVRTGGYLLALVLVALPLAVSLTAPMADPGDTRLELALVLAVFAWPVAGLLAGVGHLVGGRGSTDGE